MTGCRFLAHVISPATFVRCATGYLGQPRTEFAVAMYRTEEVGVYVLRATWLLVCNWLYNY